MALKISGSTIVDDSRQIINAAKVGIGSLNPTDELDIFATDPKIQLTREFASTSANAGSITFGNGNWDSSIAAIEGFHDGNNLAGGIRFLTQDAANNGGGGTDERLRIDSSGNLDIPFANNGTGLRQKIRFVTEADYFDEVAYISADRTAVSNAPTDLVFGTGALSGGSVSTEERLRIKSDGNIGIGTVNPTSLLTVGARPKTTTTVATVLISPASGNASIQLRGGSPTLEFDNTGGGNGQIFTDSADLAIRSGTLDSAGTELVRITSGGDVGIGSAIPQGNLDIFGSGNDDVKLYFVTPNKTKTRIGYVGVSNRFAMDIENGLQIRDAGDSYATRFLIDDVGRTLIGHTASLSEGCLLQVARANDNTVELFGYSANANGARINFTKSRNATIGVNTIVQDGDTIGELHFRAANGVDQYYRVAAIEAEIDGGVGVSSVPGRLIFSTTAPGATTQTERLRIDSSGHVLIGITASTSNDSQIQSFKPAGNNSTITVGNVATAADGLCRYDFCPSNSTVGARIECHATEDFSEVVKRTADLVFVTRKDGTNTEKLRIYSGGTVEANTSISSTYSATTNITPHLRVRNQNGTDNIYGGIELRADRGNGAAAMFNIACLNSSTNYASTLVFQSRKTDGNFDERLRIDSAGNVGINSNAPTKKLDVHGNTKVTGQFEVTTGANSFLTSANVFKGTAGQLGVYLRSALSAEGTPSYSSVDDTDTGIFLPGSDVFAVTTGGSEKLRIDSSGDVGIGTDNPGNFNDAANDLVIGTGTGHRGLTIYSGGDGDGWLVFNDAANTTLSGAIQYNHVSDYMAFRTGGATNEDRLRIDSSGRVGLGSSPENYGDAAYYDDIVINNIDGDGGNSTGGAGITLLSNPANWGALIFGDTLTSSQKGYIKYDHTNDKMCFGTNGGNGNASDDLVIDSSGNFLPATGSNYNIGASGNTFANGYFDNIHATNISGTIGSPGSDKEILFNNSGTIAGSSNFTWDTSNNDFKVYGNTIFESTGLATDPLVKLNNTSNPGGANAFLHSLDAYAALDAGDTNLKMIGKSATNKNAGYTGYRWYGDADTRNILTFGHWGENYLMNLDGNGNLGIGLTNPQKLLDLYATNPTIGVKATGGNDAQIELVETGGSAIDFGEQGAAGFRISYDGGDNRLYFVSGSDTTVNTRVSIDRDTGNVGIGSDIPGEKLDVNGAIRSVGNNWDTHSATLKANFNSQHTLALTVNQNNNTAQEVLGTYADAGGANPRIAIAATSGWKVGINSTAPGAVLDVHKANGTIARFGDISAAVEEGLLIKNDVSNYPAITNGDSTRTIALRAAGSIQMEIDANNNDTSKYFRVTKNGTGANGTELFRVQEDSAVIAYNGIETVSIDATAGSGILKIGKGYLESRGFNYVGNPFNVTEYGSPVNIQPIFKGNYIPVEGEIVTVTLSEDGKETRTFYFKYVLAANATGFNGTGFNNQCTISNLPAGAPEEYNQITTDGNGTWRFSNTALGGYSTNFETHAYNYYTNNAGAGNATASSFKIKIGTVLSIESAVGIGTAIPTDAVTDQGSLLAVAGIVTATEYYGTFKGNIGSAVGITTAADRVMIQQVSSDNWRQIVLTDNNASTYDDLVIEAETGHFAYNPSQNCLHVDKIRTNITTSRDVASTAAADNQFHTSNTIVNTALAGYGDNSGGVILALGHSRKATVGEIGEAVHDDDHLGDIRFAGDDGTDMEHTACQIIGAVDGTVDEDNIPGRFQFYCWDGTQSKERLRITSTGAICFGNSNNSESGYGNATQVLTSNGNSGPSWQNIPTQTGTTYILEGGGTNGASFGAGTGTINLKTGGAIQDTITLTAGSNVKIDGTGASGFTISSQDTNDNTTYTLPVFGTANGSSGLTLTGSDGTADDVNVTGSGGITVIGNGTDTLTIDGSGTPNDNTTYDLSVPNATTDIRLAGSDGTNDDITITGGTNCTVTRNSNTQLTIDVDTQTTVTNAQNLQISEDEGESGTNYIWFGDSSTESAYDALRIDKDGLVYMDAKFGIGTNSPDKRLHVVGNSYIEGEIKNPPMRADQLCVIGPFANIGSSGSALFYYQPSVTATGSYEKTVGDIITFTFSESGKETRTFSFEFVNSTSPAAGQCYSVNSNYNTTSGAAYYFNMTSLSGVTNDFFFNAYAYYSYSANTFKIQVGGTLTVNNDYDIASLVGIGTDYIQDAVTDQDARLAVAGIVTAHQYYGSGTKLIGNAYGNRYVQTTEPTGNNVLDGDIWYDTSVAGGSGYPNPFLTSGNAQLFGSDTSDGSDTKSIMINGGGATSDTRGGYLLVHGNEHATWPGVTRLHAGNVSTGTIDFYTAGSERLRILNDGDLSVNNRAVIDDSIGTRYVIAGAFNSSVEYVITPGGSADGVEVATPSNNIRGTYMPKDGELIKFTFKQRHVSGTYYETRTFIWEYDAAPTNNMPTSGKCSLNGITNYNELSNDSSKKWTWNYTAQSGGYSTNFLADGRNYYPDNLVNAGLSIEVGETELSTFTGLLLEKMSGGDVDDIDSHKIGFKTQSGVISEIQAVSKGLGGPAGRGGDLVFRIKSNNVSTPTDKLVLRESGEVVIYKQDVATSTGATPKLKFNIKQTNDQESCAGMINAIGTAGWGGNLEFWTKDNNATPDESLRHTMTLQGDTNRMYMFGDIHFDGAATEDNQSRQIYWTGFDKEGTADYTDVAGIEHTENTGGHSGSVLKIRVSNDAQDGIYLDSTGGTNINNTLRMNSARIQPYTGENNGLRWPSDPYGGSGDYARICYYRDAGTGENTRLRIQIENDADDDLRLEAGTIRAEGTFSASTKNFIIPHPNTSAGISTTHNLSHSSIEGPQVDLIYRGKIDLSSGTASVNIDTKAGMAEGTFVILCKDIQCFTTNETGWGAVKGSVSGNILTITAQDNSSTDTISWMVIGERQDPTIKNSKCTDDDGNYIVQPPKDKFELYGILPPLPSMNGAQQIT